MAIGKVIKSDGGAEPGLERERPPLPRPPRAGGVMNAEQYEAHGIVAQAKRHAEELLARAQAERDQYVEEGRQAGIEQGRQEGLREMSEIIARAHMQRGELLKSAEPQILELALKVAEKVIGRDLERDPSVMVDLCANAVESVRNAKQLVLRVHPKASALLRQRAPELLQLIGRSVDIAIKDDSDVDPHGCVIQTEFGTIDAQLRTQLEMLRNVLLPDDAKKDGPA
jgi:type III secretion protein L